FLDVAVFIGNPYRMKLRMTELQIESDYLTEGTQHFVAHESFVQTEPIGKLYGRLSLVDNPGIVRTGERPTRQRPVVELDTNQCILSIVVQKLKLYPSTSLPFLNRFLDEIHIRGFSIEKFDRKIIKQG